MRAKTNKYNINQNGQALIIVLLVIVVILTIGLSIAGSSIKNVQETAVIEESNRAFSAAEAGIEEVLLELDEGDPVPLITGKALPGGGVIKQVQAVDQTSLTLSTLKQDTVAQLDLECSICGVSTIQISWDSNSSIVITKISLVAGEYVVERWALNCDFNPGNNFTPKTSGAGSQCTQEIQVDGTEDLVMRIRAMYADTSIAVTPLIGSIPVQSTVVTSTGQSGEAERTVQVERSLPVPPSILDYVLFSASGPLSKN